MRQKAVNKTAKGHFLQHEMPPFTDICSQQDKKTARATQALATNHKTILINRMLNPISFSLPKAILPKHPASLSSWQIPGSRPLMSTLRLAEALCLLL